LISYILLKKKFIKQQREEELDNDNIKKNNYFALF